MLQKVEKITSIGKFRDYQASGDVALKKVTLIYADNGSGKSTLTSILRSGSSNDKELLLRRKSTNSQKPQNIKLIHRTATGDLTSNFSEANGWSRTIDGVEIFDAHFVNENVYSGFSFSEDHKKQLHQFVVGSDGVAIARSIEENKSAKAKKRAVIDEIGGEIVTLVGNGLTGPTLAQFLAIKNSELSSATAQLPTALQALENANANAAIQSIGLPSRLIPPVLSLDLVALATDLESGGKTIQDQALEVLFTEHCGELTSNTIVDAEAWLQKGYNYYSAKLAEPPPNLDRTVSCPFCKQPMQASTVEILRAYADKFSGQYAEFVSRISRYLTSLQSIHFEVFVSSVSATLAGNDGLVTSWQVHIPDLSSFSRVGIDTAMVPITEILNQLVGVAQKKGQNPTLEILDHGVSDFVDALAALNRELGTYNTAIGVFNERVGAFRSGIQTPLQAQGEVDRLRRIVRRFEADIVTQVNSLKLEKAALLKLDADYNQLMNDQRAIAENFLALYQDRINYYLSQVFRTPFKIENVIHVAPQGKATQSKLQFKLTIDGQDVSFDPTLAINVKDTLSEGDKSTMALAFFMSKLDIDPGVPNRIVVFDDPLSSFDSNRRSYTVEICKNLSSNVEQLVVLSHNEHFLFDLWKLLEPADKKTLRIAENFVTGSSFIEPLSLEDLVENEYFKHLRSLEQFLSNPEIAKRELVLGWIRTVLEAHIRFKFYRQVSILQPAKQTLGALIGVLASQGVVFRENHRRNEIITRLGTLNGVSCRPHHGEPTPEPQQVVDPNRITVKELAGFVTDTLDLVDSLL